MNDGGGVGLTSSGTVGGGVRTGMGGGGVRVGDA